MAEFQKGRQKPPFSHIRDSIVSTKSKYKPLASSETSREDKGGPDHAENVSDLPMDDGPRDSRENSSKTKHSSVGSKKPQRPTKVSAEGAIREKIRNWDGWVPVKEGNEMKGETQADGANNAALSPMNESAIANEHSWTTKKSSSKKSSKKGSVANVGWISCLSGGVSSNTGCLNVNKNVSNCDTR